MLVVFGFGCLWMLIVLALVRNWRSASARDEEPAADEEPLHEVDDPDDWLAAEPRPTLLLPRSADARQLEHDAPRAS